MPYAWAVFGAWEFVEMPYAWVCGGRANKGTARNETRNGLVDGSATLDGQKRAGARGRCARIRYAPAVFGAWEFAEMPYARVFT